jgi:predicted small integral membrane protein
MNNRHIKIFFGISIGLYMLLVCINNITDYGTNFQFVSKVSGMEDIFSLERNGWRAISNRLLHHIFYIGIIVFELLIMIFVSLGVIRMINRRKDDVTEFRKAGNFLRTGLFLGVILWFTVFVTVGGEWFLMWQSKTWNGQQTAFFLTICFMLFLIYLNQKEQEGV